MSRCCRMFNRCLVLCSMRLGVPFIALRGLGAVGAPFGRLWLPSVRGCTRLSGAHRTVNNAMTKNPLIGYFLLLGAPDCPVCGSGPSDAPIVRWLETDVATSRWLASTPDYPAHRVDGPVNYSRQRQIFPENWLFGGSCTGLFSGWLRTVRSYAERSTFSFFNLSFSCSF
jgi:hypothetical protein